MPNFILHPSSFILVLAAGCLPLAVLTAAAFRELAATPQRVAVRIADDEGTEIAALVRRSRAESLAERPAAAALLQSALLAPQPVAALEAVAPQSPLEDVSRAWSAWLRLQEMIAAGREAEQLAAAGRPEDLQRASARFAQLADKYRVPLGGADGPLGDHFRRRAGELAAEIELRKSRARADALVEQARQAFRDDQNSGCVAVCEDLLSHYAAALDADTLEKVRLLQRRAEFREDAFRLTRALAADEKPEPRLKSLQAFLDRWGRDASAATPSERSALETFTADLRDAEAALVAARQSRAGLKLVDRFRQNPPPTPGERLESAAKILARHPAEAVRKSLQADVRQWLADALPAKRLDEPEMLQELETRDGQIARGYFKRVGGSGGSVVGYKRYPTLEQLRDPISEVGTFLKESLRSEPQASLPRRCLSRYEEARTALLNEPGQAELWTQFAQLCDELEAELRVYRAKPGASAEPLAFAAEAQTARQFAALLARPEIRRLVEP
jgi:hypothetical protein